GGADWRVDEVDTVWLRLDRVGNTITGSYWSWPGGEHPANPPEVWTASASHEVAFGDTQVGLATTSHEQGVPIEVSYTDLCIGPYVGPPILVAPEMPDSPVGGEGYIAIQEVIDNGEIRDQGACYASLNSGEGSITGHWKPVLNLWDSGGNGHFGPDDPFAVVDLGYREQGSVDDLSLIARGTIRIPPGQGGLYTFGVNSDDGFTLQLPGQNFLIGENGRIVNFESGAALQFYGDRGAADTLGVIELPPGDYPFWLTYHEGWGEASVEFFAAKGEHVAFNPDAFHLVGGPGGLELAAPRLISDVTGDGVVNYEDLDVMTGEWLAGDDLMTDLHPDGKIDFLDFGIFADQWKQYVTVGLSSPATVNTNAGTDSVDDKEPRVATDGKGNWVVVWQSSGGFGSDSDILFSRSVNDGKGWSPVVALNSNASSDSAEDTWPRVAADGKGNWVVVWQSSGFSGTDPDILFSRSADNGNSWSAVAALNLNAASDASIDIYPALAADGKGNWVVVWQGPGLTGYDSEIMYSHSGDDGKTWTYPAALNNYAGSDSATDMTPDIACDGSTWMTVWSSNYNTGGIGTDSDILFSLSTTKGKVWGTAKAANSNAGTDSAGDSYPEIANGTGWNWVVVWQSNPSYGPDFDILLAQTQDGGLSWYPPELANDYGKTDTTSDTEPCIAADGTGEMVTVWTTGGDPTWTIGTDVDALFSYSKDDGRNWSKAQPLNLTATVDAAADWYPDVAGDGKGTWLAVWHSNYTLGGTGSDYDIFVTRFKLP
ncbi:MAG: sialidase family protein, partial [Planctomycetota bacterium]